MSGVEMMFTTFCLAHLEAFRDWYALAIGERSNFLHTQLSILVLEGPLAGHTCGTTRAGMREGWSCTCLLV